MANPDRPSGFHVIDNGQVPRLRKYTAGTTTDIFRGNIVSIDADGHVANCLTTTGSITVNGVAANFVDASASSSGQDVWVYDDPHQEFWIQDDGDSATPATASIGATAVLILTAGNTTTGQSKQELDASGNGTAATDAVVIVGFKLSPDVTVGKNAPHIVKLNRHILAMGSAGI